MNYLVKDKNNNYLIFSRNSILNTNIMRLHIAPCNNPFNSGSNIDEISN